MPTLNWIQETGWDRYWETGSDHVVVPEVSTYTCRICGQCFDSVTERDQHEIGHPIQNPAIFFKGKEAGGEYLDITSPLLDSDLYLRNIDFVYINGNACEVESDFLEKLTEEKITFLDVRYGNTNLERQVKIRVCIADPDELLAIDRAFIQCFEVAGVNDSSIVAFSEKVGCLPTVKEYGNGLVRYLQGLMAKDNRSDFTNFEKFFERFNQATQSLKHYETGLCRAVSAVVNFNRNDFKAVGFSGIPQLDNAIAFFNGGDIVRTDPAVATQLLPVDYASEFILTTLLSLYIHGSLRELEDEIGTFSPEFLSLQDQLKFDFICWRKAIQEGNENSEKAYRRRLRLDDAFSGMVESGE